jgi:hypothetical protein
MEKESQKDPITLYTFCPNKRHERVILKENLFL